MLPLTGKLSFPEFEKEFQRIVERFQSCLLETEGAYTVSDWWNIFHAWLNIVSIEDGEKMSAKELLEEYLQDTQ